MACFIRRLQTSHTSVVLILSPSAGQVASGPSPVDLLEAAGVAVGERVLVHELDPAHPRGAHWRRQGYAAAVVAGGDGTVGAGATQLAGSGLPLGILPLGTSNDSARSLGVPLDLARASATIAQGIATEIDLGQVVSMQVDPAAPAVTHAWHWLHRVLPPGAFSRQRVAALHGRYFLHALTLGLNVEFARLATDVGRRERWRGLTYPASFLAALAHFQPVSVILRLSGCVSADAGGVARGEEGDRTITCTAVQIAVVNTPVVGGGVNVRLPRVDPQDHLLDFIVINALEWPQLGKTLEGLRAAVDPLHDASERDQAAPVEGARGSDDEPAHERAGGLVLPGVQHYQARAARLEPPQPVDISVDGEIGPRTPIAIGLASEPLRVLLPAGA